MRWLLAIAMLLCVTPVHGGVNMQGCQVGGDYYVEPVVDGFVGNKEGDDDGQSGGIEPDVCIWQAFVASTSGTVSYVHVKLAGAVGDYNVAIYDSAGTTKLKDGSLSTINVSGIDWAHFALDSGLDITATTTYVLACGQKTDSDSWCRARLTDAVGETYNRDTSCDVEDSMPSSVSPDLETSPYQILIYADNSAT